MDKVLSYLGLAMKAGKLVSGEFSTEKAVKSRRSSLVIVAEDASDNTKKNFSDMASYYDVPIIFHGTREELGAATGKRYRASLAVTDEGLSKAILKSYEE